MSESAVVAAWELGLRLRQHRDRLDFSTSIAAARTRMQSSNLSSVETSRKRITAANLAKLGKLYELEPEELAELEALRVAAERRDWYHQYEWLFCETFLRYLGLEHGADQLQVYENSFIPGPLQTVDYASALIRSGSPYTRLTEAEPRLEARMARRARLTGEHPLRITALLTETVLCQRIGNAAIMHEQLVSLADLAQQEQVQVRIMPFRAGAYPALGGTFHILSFDSAALPDVVYQETLTSATIIEGRHHVREYAVALAESMPAALSPQDSIDLIQQVAKEIT